MTATTRDVIYTRRDGGLIERPIAADTKVYGGTLLCLDSSGRVVDGEVASGLRFAGLCERAVDNIDGAAEAEHVLLRDQGEFLLTGSGFSASSLGRPVFLLDNATVTLGASDLEHWIQVGVVVEVVSSTQAWVRLTPLAESPRRQVTIRCAGANAAALDLSAAAEAVGLSDVYVLSVEAVVSYTTSTGALDALLASSAYALADGVVSTTGNKSANTLFVTCTAIFY